jgi:L-ascorbate metabolism protein UlaG (beta-lactamase superfamily)
MVIYIDPWQIPDGPAADLILITHDHFDHCSPEDVARIRTPKTVILTVAAAAAKLPQPVRVVQAGEKREVGDILIETVPAYNIDKFRAPGVVFHPKEAGNVGFILTVDERRIYHAGDTDLIPEMAGIVCDIAMLPISGTYVMTVTEAAEAAGLIRPKLAIPMHYGSLVGSSDDARHFEQSSSVPVKILPYEGRST